MGSAAKIIKVGHLQLQDPASIQYFIPSETNRFLVHILSHVSLKTNEIFNQMSIKLQ